jgi:hypothetical protein
MGDEIAGRPPAAAVLRHLAATRGPDDPLGSLAHTVISGDAGLRAAAAYSWHGEGLLTAFAAALDERDRMTGEQRAAYDRAAERLGVTG